MSCDASSPLHHEELMFANILENGSNGQPNIHGQPSCFKAASACDAHREMHLSRGNQMASNSPITISQSAFRQGPSKTLDQFSVTRVPIHLSKTLGFLSLDLPIPQFSARSEPPTPLLFRRTERPFYSCGTDSVPTASSGFGSGSQVSVLPPRQLIREVKGGTSTAPSKGSPGLEAPTT